MLLNLFFMVSVFGQTNFGDIQPKDNSPFSRFGIGDLINQNFVSTIGMGGLSAAQHDPLHLNILNPASLGFLRATAFEVGFNGEYSTLENKGESASGWNGNLNYIAIGFPLKNPINEVLDRKLSQIGWGMNLALVPYSIVGYDIQTEAQVDTLQITNRFRGSGGTYRFLWGNAVRYKDLSVGVNLGYIFGKVSNRRYVFFENLPTHYYYNDLLSEYSISGFNWNIGVQYDYVFKKAKKDGVALPTGKKITIGAYGNSATSFSTNSDELFTRLPIPSSFSGVDTISSQQGIIGSGQLPAEFSIGLMYQKVNKFKIGINYKTAQWSQYENDAQPEDLLNTYQVAFGGEYIPDFLSYNRYLKKVRYRFGAFYGTDARSFNGEQLQEYGVSLGFGLPIILPRQQTSFINFALEAGKFGLSDSLNETYIRMSVGFTLNDNTWFFKRKFN